MLKKLFSHTAIYGLAPQITRIASLFALPIITKDLTTIDFGVYGLITSIVGAITVLNTLGLRIILTNSFYKSSHQYIWGWRQIYGFLMLWNIPYSLLLGLVIWFFIPVEATHNALYIVFVNVIPVVFFGPTSSIATTYYQLKQRPSAIAIRSAFFGLLTVCLNVLFISYYKMGYMGWFLSTGISTMAHQMSYFIPLNFNLRIRPIFNFKWRYIRNSLKVSLPTIPHYYSTYLLDSSDRLIMKAVGISTSSIGLYNAAYTVANFVRQGGMAAGFAIGPMMNEAFKQKEEGKARNLVFILQAIFLTGSFILAIWLKELFVFLIKNDELKSSYNIGVILVMAYSYRPMYLGANSKLFYIEKTALLLRITFVAAILNVVLNFIFIPIWGIVAAAWVTFISLMYMGFGGFFIQSINKYNEVNYYPKIWLGLIIVMTGLSLSIVEQGIAVKIVATILTVVVSFAFVHKISKK